MKNAFERQNTIDQESVAKEMKKITHISEKTGEMKNEMKKTTRSYDWSERGINRMSNNSNWKKKIMK